LATRRIPEIPFDNELLGLMMGGADGVAPGLAAEPHQEDFREAFREGFATLTDRERSLLRYAFGEGLTVEAMGTIYGVHKTTTARWVVRAHETLLERVRSALMARLQISTEEYESLLRGVISHLDLSLERYLGAPRD
jgi:RNA polymerase sigma-70 factor (ECF subfamily)